MTEVIGQQDGDFVSLLKCLDCGAYYETDETVTNDCPDCHAMQFDILEGDMDKIDDWREDPEAFDPDA